MGTTLRITDLVIGDRGSNDPRPIPAAGRPGSTSGTAAQRPPPEAPAGRQATERSPAAERRDGRGEPVVRPISGAVAVRQKVPHDPLTQRPPRPAPARRRAERRARRRRPPRAGRLRPPRQRPAVPNRRRLRGRRQLLRRSTPRPDHRHNLDWASVDRLTSTWSTTRRRDDPTVYCHGRQGGRPVPTGPTGQPGPAPAKADIGNVYQYVAPAASRRRHRASFGWDRGSTARVAYALELNQQPNVPSPTDRPTPLATDARFTRGQGQRPRFALVPASKIWTNGAWVAADPSRGLNEPTVNTR